MYGTLEEAPAVPAPFDPAAALEKLGLPVPEVAGTAVGDGEDTVFQPLPEASNDVRECLTLKDALIHEGVEPDRVGELLAVARETRPAPVNPKDLLGMKKPDLSLVPPASNLYQAQAMMDGAAKYGPYNWRENPVLARVYIAAAQRHIAQFLDGEDFDPTSGVHHMGHALACLGIIADARETGNLIDDRPSRGPASAMIRRFNDTQSYR